MASAVRATPSDVQMLRMLWIDYSGIRRSKVVPTHRRDKPLRVTKACMILTAWGALPTGVTQGPVGEVLMTVGSRSVKLPWHPNHELTIANLVSGSDEERALPTSPVIPSSPWIHCPRSCLLRAAKSLKDKGLVVKTGFELEFMLFAPAEYGGRPKPVGRSKGYCVYDQLDVAASCLDEMVMTLAKMEIYVQMLHCESFQGQYELVLTHKDVVKAVDDLVLARETVRAVARKHNWIASFIPCYEEDASGNGSHVHLSINGHFGTEDIAHGMRIGVSTIGQHFMGGVLKSLPWLLFLLMANPISYERLRPMHWVGAYHTWGVNNKEAPIRLVEDRSNFEVKLLDGISNPYLALAGILLAGERGIAEKTALPKPTTGDPHWMNPRERPALLPNKLDISMQYFMEYYYHEKHNLSKVFPDEMVYEMAAVRQTEIDYVQKHGKQRYRDMMFSLH